MAELPKLTDEQIRANLEKATAARTERKKFKDMLKAGGMPVEVAITQPVAQKIKAFDFIKSFPKVGKAKALDIMSAVRIRDNRRVGGLTERQKRGVIDAITEIKDKPGAWKPKEDR